MKAILKFGGIKVVGKMIITERVNFIMIMEYYSMKAISIKVSFMAWEKSMIRMDS